MAKIYQAQKSSSGLKRIHRLQIKTVYRHSKVRPVNTVRISRKGPKKLR